MPCHPSGRADHASGEPADLTSRDMACVPVLKSQRHLAYIGPMTHERHDMQVPIDVNAMRDASVEAHGLTGVDDVHTLYYDESNNLRRLHVTPAGLNVREPQVFVLGGVVHPGPPRELGFAELRAALHLQPTVRELKFEHVAKGDLLRVLSSRKLTALLEWLLGSDLLVHYIALDPLYWSTVDIVDSVVADAPFLQAFAPRLKNDLHAVLRADLPGMVGLFSRYGYPDVGARGPAFMAELLGILEARHALIDDFGFQMLRGVLQMGRDAERLPFLSDEPRNVLLESLAPFVIHRLCLFKNSRHILDVEPVIQRALARNRFTDRGRELSLHRFALSHEEPGVQVSDAVVGLIAKCLSWVVARDAPDVEAACASLDATQEENRRMLAELLDRSTDATPAFAQRVISADDDTKAALLLAP